MLKNEIEIPEGIEASLENGLLSVKGKSGDVSKTFKHPRIKIKIENRMIVIVSDLDRKKSKAIMGTWNAHVNNMFMGADRGWKGELKLVYSHFPVKMKTEGNEFVIENFIGERNARKVPIPEDMKVEVKGSEICVTGVDKERVGQLCARIEQITKIRGFDRRVFQDGIYITKKPYTGGEDGERRDAKNQEENKEEKA